MEVASFRDLRVWQVGMSLVVHVYCLTESFPAHETYGLANQMRRSAVSIPSNLAEGHARESTREYLHFVSVAQGSLAELETQLEIAVRLQYLTQHQLDEASEEIASLRKQLYALRNSLARRLTADPRPPTPVP